MLVQSAACAAKLIATIGKAFINRNSMVFSAS
jgi:hypothetical protein